jgi:hypothetical protein
MSINNASLVTAPTSIVVTGGTALAFASSGLVDGVNPLFVSADTDFRTRRTLTISAKPAKPSPSAPNGYTQLRMSAIYRKPKTLANGKITVNTLKAEMAYDVETTQAEIQELVDILAQLGCDADFTQLWKAANPN